MRISLEESSEVKRSILKPFCLNTKAHLKETKYPSISCAIGCFSEFDIFKEWEGGEQWGSCRWTWKKWMRRSRRRGAGPGQSAVRWHQPSLLPPCWPRGSPCLVLGTSAPSGLAEEVILQKGPAWLPRSKGEGRRGRMPLAWAGDYPILFCFQGSRRSLCGKKSCYSPGRHPNALCRRRAELPNSPFRMQRALSCSSYTSGLL